MNINKYKITMLSGDKCYGENQSRGKWNEGEILNI